jgi:hypothetical protein
MIKKAKGIELMKFVFITNLNTFGSKVLWIWIWVFNKICSWLCDRGHECTIYMI